jgi:hypothetical protein
MIQELEDKTSVKLNVCLAHPDYVKNQPGEAFGGRAFAPAEFDASVLGSDFKYVRPPRPEFMGLGGMMVNRNELNALLNPFFIRQKFYDDDESRFALLPVTVALSTGYPFGDGKCLGRQPFL